MDKSRQQFEEIIKQLSDPSEFESKLKRANNGLNYADQYVDLMWISWQASRESLEVELPKKCNTSIAGDTKTKYYFNGINEGIDKCKQILISNGVKIKK
ncbi:hypothetical protein JEP66_13095 [Proteus mirabilis]|uniref:hypothetical protein n=1 Tax=Proteus mirabilis TaxID=584 RepID=UPI001A2820DE|nr:hypothetical protein [Proteus mirabilis]MBI6242167.1 hypothetical protein [Proteus mirabilis]MCI9737496.1 hypothetical protein [Proteus mirabilis]MCI9750905.1 hypothetical protein [Proteus mirabilis]MCI9764626.1 hypothetical protein [Proteus mirabilis]MCI9780254.1 hypothetical protein [Proteus mirabilis]